MNKKPHVILHHTKKEETQGSSLSPELKITNMFTHGSGGGIDDEYYINEIIGIDDFTYEDFIKKPEPRLQRTEAQKNFFHLHHTTKEGK